MSLTKKRLIQIPLLFLLIFFVILPLEWSVFSQLPFYLGPLNILSILITYLALTRSLAQTVFWGMIIGFICSLTYPFGYGAIIAAYAWSALAAKLITYTFPFDSRIPFVALVLMQSTFCKALWRILTFKTYHGIATLDFILKSIPSYLSIGLLAYFLLPILVVWDEFFENNATSGSELSPGITGMSR